MWTRKIAFFSLLVTLLVGLTGWISEAQITPDVIGNAIVPTVYLLIPLDTVKERFKQCSGAVVSPSGLILTAGHCVRAPSNEPKIKKKKGDLYNPEAVFFVGINQRPDSVNPVLAFVAQRIIDDPRLDLALVKIKWLLTKEGRAPLPDNFRAPVMQLGDSDKVRIGDPISVIGFPGTGGSSVTAPQGHVTGFTADDQDRKIAMKHDVNAGPGSSGGPVITTDGREVGVHVALATEEGATTFYAVPTDRIPSAWAQYFEGGAVPSEGGPPVPRPALAAGVVIQGNIVDADSRIGISGASFILFRPGVDPGAATEQDVVALARTDGRGFFQTSQGVPRGATYPGVVLAQGYTPNPGNLALGPSEPEIIRLEFELQRQ